MWFSHNTCETIISLVRVVAAADFKVCVIGSSRPVHIFKTRSLK